MEWDKGRGRLPMTSELGLSSVLTPSVLVLLRPNQVQSEYKPRPNQDQTELRSHTGENHVMETGSLACIPESVKITATVSYQTPVDEI